MGTRGLTAVVKGGQFKVAQYGQWDHYPEGQGKTILNFLQKANLVKFSQQVDKCRFITDEEGKKIDAELAALGGNDWGKWAHMSRDVGGKILQTVQSNRRKELLLVDSSRFAIDSLFCEYAYVVDLDNGELEIYKGFQNAPVPDGERFAVWNGEDEAPGAQEHRKKKYYPVRLLTKFKLVDLPSEVDFMAAIDAKLREQYPEDYKDE